MNNFKNFRNFIKINNVYLNKKSILKIIITPHCPNPIWKKEIPYSKHKIEITTTENNLWFSGLFGGNTYNKHYLMFDSKDDAHSWINQVVIESDPDTK